jgi:hypothetical protein
MAVWSIRCVDAAVAQLRAGGENVDRGALEKLLSGSSDGDGCLSRTEWAGGAGGLLGGVWVPH